MPVAWGIVATPAVGLLWDQQHIIIFPSERYIFCSETQELDAKGRKREN